MICETKQGNQLPGVLFVIVWTSTSGFLLQSDRLIRVKTIETARQDLAKGDRDHLIEVTA